MTGAVDAEVLDPRLFLGDGVPRIGEPVVLRISRCSRCGRVEFPVRARCPLCGAHADETGLTTEGHLDGFTTVLHPPPGALVEVPYVVGLVAFSEEIAILGQVVGASAEQIAIGDRVQTVAVAVGGRAGYGFQPVVGRCASS